ncbi:MAG: HEAT repeat domain-containing protein [Candidatus Omnitrophica bacterium]|nr:HEAT repeat domain-containing protein [Candidatus Omnitrophota bacterium]
MKRMIELKHVGPRGHVQRLLEELIDRLGNKLKHFPDEAVSLHVLFEENGAHKLYRTSLTCHVPGHTVAAHEERREAGSSIREAFAELERQLEKQKAILRHEYRRRHERTRAIMVGACLLLAAPKPGWGEAQPSPVPTPSPQAAEAVTLLESEDPYERQMGFLRLEALREVSTVETIQKYVTDRDPDMRAYSLRALAAIEGPAAVPLLLQALKKDRQPRVRWAAILGLEAFQQADPQILPAFIKALRDASTEVRISAIDVVSRIDDPRAREAIRIRDKRERRPDVRRVLALAMKRLGNY